MDEMSRYSSYGEYKQALDSELQKTAEGFVKIGFLLKQARDTNILEESGYKNYIEFAQAEYGIDKTTVSRFIRINDKFAEDGNSEQLQEQYRGFGYAKLAIMLQLPDEVNNIITPDFSKSEINALKDEVDEEGKVSDLEVMMEQEPMRTKYSETTLDKAMMQLLHDETDLYINLHRGFEEGQTAEEKIKMISNVMAPAETKVYTVRIPGVGRLMVSMKGIERDIEVVNVRSGEKEAFTWEVLLDIVVHMCAMGKADAKEAWSRLYLERFPEEEPKKVEVAPVQQKKPEPKKQSKVTKAKVDVPKPEKQEEMGQKETEETSQEEEENSQNTEMTENEAPESLHDIDSSIPAPDSIEDAAETQQNDEDCCEVQQDTDEQIPGQDTVENHPEWIPEKNTEKSSDVIDAEFREIDEKQHEDEMKPDFEADMAAVEESPQRTAMQELIQREIDKLVDNVNTEKWEQALMDLENIEFKIKKAMDMTEDEEDED